MADELADRAWPHWHIVAFFKIHGEAASPMVTDCVQRVTGVAPNSFASFLRSRPEFQIPRA